VKGICGEMNMGGGAPGIIFLLSFFCLNIVVAFFELWFDISFVAIPFDLI
jgi:hypothetical protein